MNCLRNVRLELEHPVDRHSKELLSVHVELLLDYCMRFYDRQFCTRKKANSDVLQQFERYLDDYFRSGEPQKNGLPSVKYVADKVCLSSGYFGDLVKKETGKTAQEYVQNKIIDLSKIWLLGTRKGIGEISYSLGFQYPQHFSRLFRKHTGCTPNEYRLQNA